MNLLARDDAPLSSEQWAALDTAVVGTARKYLVGRRFIPLFGPLGEGLPVVPAGELTGLEAGGTIVIGEPQLLPLATLSQDFCLQYRDLQMADRLGLPQDLAPAAAAARSVAVQEDQLVFAGLLAAQGAHRIAAGDWSAPGGLFGDVVKAIEALGQAGCPGPYAVAVNPGTYAGLYRPMGQGPHTEKDLVADIARAGLFASATLQPQQALVLEPGPANADLAIGGDLRTAYLGNEGMDHRFRVFETLALRVKRAAALAVLGG